MTTRKLMKSSLPLYHALIRRLDPQGDRVFFDPADFPWIPDLEGGWPLIRTELDSLLREREHLPAFHEVEPGQAEISSERWRSLLFWVYGAEVPENCARCPQTAALLRAIPGMTTALFSVLESNTHIPPHCGPFKGVLRYHLGLVVPSRDRCEIRVHDQLRRWGEGQSLVFDDTFEHEVWNESSEPRVILFVDFLRPLRWPLSALNRFLMAIARHSPPVRQARENARRFARADADRVA